MKVLCEMTLTELLNTLKTQDADAPLVFSSDDAVTRGGYHVTELKRAKITSIDCGGRTSEWSEAALQLLDGQGGTHMKTGKFVGILAQSLSAVDTLGTAPAHVEFAPRNAGLRRYEIEEVVQGADQVEVRLKEASAICKPALAVSRASGGAGQAASHSRCCG